MSPIDLELRMERLAGATQAGERRVAELVTARYPLLVRMLSDDELERIVLAFFIDHPHEADVCARLGGFLADVLPWSRSPILAHLAAYDFQRSGAALAAEEVAVMRAELDDDLRVRIKKRAALIATQFRFHALRIAELRWDTPLDAHPTYLLVHLARRRFETVELGRDDYLELQRVVAGARVGEMRDVVERWVDDELFVRCS